MYRYQTIRRRVGEYRDLNVHRCENIIFLTDMAVTCSVLSVTVCWNVTLCIQVGSDERFRGTFCPNLPVKDGGTIPICLTTRKKEIMHFSVHRLKQWLLKCNVVHGPAGWHEIIFGFRL
jgi:hypothetical protein